MLQNVKLSSLRLFCQHILTQNVSSLQLTIHPAFSELLSQYSQRGYRLLDFLGSSSFKI